MKRILTYGTFDLLHYGHIRILERAKALGDYLVVAVSTDEFNAVKGKKAYHDYETRKKMLESMRCVDLVIPEEHWDQKRNDVLEYKIDTVVMGSDWEDNPKFECLKDICEVKYLPRTQGVSTTKIKKDLGLQEPSNTINQLPIPTLDVFEKIRETGTFAEVTKLKDDTKIDDDKLMEYMCEIVPNFKREDYDYFKELYIANTDLFYAALMATAYIPTGVKEISKSLKIELKGAREEKK